MVFAKALSLVLAVQLFSLLLCLQIFDSSSPSIPKPSPGNAPRCSATSQETSCTVISCFIDFFSFFQYAIEVLQTNIVSIQLHVLVFLSEPGHR